MCYFRVSTIFIKLNFKAVYTNTDTIWCLGTNGGNVVLTPGHFQQGVILSSVNTLFDVVNKVFDLVKPWLLSPCSGWTLAEHCPPPSPVGLIKQFLRDVDWGEVDYLLIDTPPGTSDEHLSIVQYLSSTQVDGAVVITTPQEVALLDVRKEINFCKKVNLPVIGVVENMSGFVCPKCKVRETSGITLYLYIIFFL